MAGNKKKNKKSSEVNNDQNNNNCPKKEGDNCLVPGGFNDTDPVGGG